jgi:type IV secretory pathway TrbF-like protein
MNLRFATLKRLWTPVEPAQAETDSPYLSARRAWNDHVGRLVAARTLWQAVGLISLLIALCAVGGVVHLASQSQFIPYVVQVDDRGRLHAMSRADQMPAASRAVIESQLESFITLSRRVTTDIALERAAIFALYAMLAPDDPAAVKMTEHLNGDPTKTPFARAKSETVSTAITSILPQTANSWQVEWTEIVFSREGKAKAQVQWRALVDVYQSQPHHTTEEALRDNPLGVYIRDYSWNPITARGVKK